MIVRTHVYSDWLRHTNTCAAILLLYLDSVPHSTASSKNINNKSDARPCNTNDSIARCFYLLLFFARSCWSVFVPILVLIHYNIMWIYWTSSSSFSLFIICSVWLSVSLSWYMLANPIDLNWFLNSLFFCGNFPPLELASNKKNHRPLQTHRALEMRRNEKEDEHLLITFHYISFSSSFTCCYCCSVGSFSLGIWLPQFPSLGILWPQM